MSHERPNIVNEAHLMYLDDLRESGKTNMWGSGAYLQRSFSELNHKEVAEIVQYWMESFGERHPQ